MNEKSVTTITLKKINKRNVYRYIYRNRLASKLQIVQDLHMGLSTVSQNLNVLEEEGLIERKGSFDSTGGRKAQAIRIVPDKKNFHRPGNSQTDVSYRGCGSVWGNTVQKNHSDAIQQYGRILPPGR